MFEASALVDGEEVEKRARLLHAERLVPVARPSGEAMSEAAKPQTPLTDALFNRLLLAWREEPGMDDRHIASALHKHARTLEKESALLTERLSLSQQERHTLEVECRELRAQNDKLRRALQHAHEHVSELREAWQRGCISEHDGHGGMRSNRNVEVETEARVCLAAIKQGEGT